MKGGMGEMKTVLLGTYHERRSDRGTNRSFGAVGRMYPTEKGLQHLGPKH